jgi:imidazole glycerol phosphate synthase subunit HisF
VVGQTAKKGYGKAKIVLSSMDAEGIKVGYDLGIIAAAATRAPVMKKLPTGSLKSVPCHRIPGCLDL